MEQSRLFHESIYEALTTVIGALGGPKKVGPMLWPEKTIDAAAQLVRDCLNPSRKERFDPEQTIFLLRKGREANCHAAINYLCAESGYANPQPIEPETEFARLQREYIDAVKTLQSLTPKIEETRARLKAV